MDVLYIIGRGIIFFSIAFLVVGLLANLFQRTNSYNKYVVYYLSVVLLTECTVLFTGVYLEWNFLALFTISFFTHFIFLTHFYNKTIFQFSTTRRNLLLALGVIPLFVHCTTDSSLVWLQYYARIPYSLIISLYSLGYFYALMIGKLENRPVRNLFNGSILLFFTIDAFLGTGTAYLVKREYLDLVAWFWFFRAIFLQFFYGALIYYGWKQPKEI